MERPDIILSPVEKETRDNALEIKRVNPNISMKDLAKQVNISINDLKRLLEPIGEYTPSHKAHIIHKPQIQHYPSKSKLNFHKKLADERHNGIITCEICGLTNWKNIPLINFAQKDHVNGNPKDNTLGNIRTVCPNCHAHTTTRFRIKDSHNSRFETSLSKKNVITSLKDVLGSIDMQKRLKQQQQNDLKHSSANAKPLQDIIDGKVPSYRTSRYVDRLIGAGYKPNCCECCKATEWRGIEIGLFLVGHHKDGNAANHKLENIEVLCPNCHFCKHTFETTTNANLKGQQATFLSSNPVSYDLNSERVIKIKTLLESTSKPATMTACAKQLGITYKELKTITLREFPHLWVTDMGSARRLNLNDPVVEQQIAIIQELKAQPNHTKYGAEKIAVQKHNIPRKRYRALYKHLYNK